MSLIVLVITVNLSHVKGMTVSEAAENYFDTYIGSSELNDNIEEIFIFGDESLIIVHVDEGDTTPKSGGDNDFGDPYVGNKIIFMGDEEEN